VNLFLKAKELDSSRSENSIRNATVSICISAIVTLAAFANRTVFAKVLVPEYLGLNGLFTNILGYLSMTELGIGNVVAFALYRPIKENDIEKIKSLMKEYYKLYCFVALFMMIIGVLITPFLNFFIMDDVNEIPYIRCCFLIYVLSQAIYILINCHRTIIVCNQKEYILSIGSGCIHLILNAIQICLLIIFKSYVGYLVCMLLFSFIECIWVINAANKLYPYLREENIRSLTEEEKGVLNKNIKAQFFHRVGAIIVGSTDNIIISKFVGLVLGGLYSNYILIIDALKKCMIKLYSSISASIGNLMAGDSKEYNKGVFFHILFIHVWLTGFISICLICLFRPFITIWLGQEFLLSDNVVIIAVVGFYISCVRLPVIAFKETAGIYIQDKYKDIIEAVVNLVLSLILVRFLGISGVIIGTIISDICVAMWYEGLVLFRDGFESGIKKYLLLQLNYFLLNALLLILCYFLCERLTSSLNEENVLTIIVRVIICIFIPNLLYLLLFYRTDDFKYFKDMLLRGKK